MKIFCLVFLCSFQLYAQEVAKEFKQYVTSLNVHVKNSKNGSWLEFYEANRTQESPKVEDCTQLQLTDGERVFLIEVLEKYELFDTGYWFHPKYLNQPDSMVVAGSVYKVVDGKIVELYDQEISVSNDTYLYFQLNYDTPGHENVNFSVIKEKTVAIDFLNDIELLFGQRVCVDDIKIE